MEPKDGKRPGEAGGVRGEAVTLGSRGNSQRTDTEILDELADVARRLKPGRLADHLEPDATSPEPS